MNQDTINAINQWAAEIEHAVVQAAPKVWAVAVAVKRADCVGALLTNGIVVLLCIVAMITAARYLIALWGQFLATAKSWKSDYEGADAHFNYNLLFPMAGLVVIFFVGFCTAYSWSEPFFDQWIWIGAFNPSLAVSHDIIIKALSQ